MVASGSYRDRGRVPADVCYREGLRMISFPPGEFYSLSVPRVVNKASKHSEGKKIRSHLQVVGCSAQALVLHVGLSGF